MKIVARCKGVRATHANAIKRGKGSKAQRHKGSTDECNNKCKNSNKAQGVKKLYNNGKAKALTKLKQKHPSTHKTQDSMRKTSKRNKKGRNVPFVKNITVYRR